MKNHEMIVIGASAGGVQALKRIAADLDPDLAATICIVMHMPADYESELDQIINRAGPLPAKMAENGETIKTGRIYVAPPNHHLIIKDGYLKLSRGPFENRSRPAIDPLFRSAAVAYGSRAIGVILSGYLDDGTSGMVAIQRCGGVTMVLDPTDTPHGDMPKSVLSRINVDYKLRLVEIGSTLNCLVTEPAGGDVEIPEEVIREAQLAERIMSDIKTEERLGELVPMSCPECGGPLWEIDVDQVKRYRCHVGHGFTEWALLVDQDESIEQALWMAMRTMEERANLLDKMAESEHRAGRSRTEKNFRERADESRTHANAIRGLMLKKG